MKIVKITKRIGSKVYQIKNMKKIFLTFVLLLCQTVFAQMAEVEVNPSEALVNESFYVIFKIKSTGNVEPFISFDPINAEVLGRKEQGVSIQTTVINGKFTTSREQSYVYEMISDRAGTAMLKNVQVEVNGKTEKLKDVRVNILNEKRKLQDVFLEAVPSKTKIYVGEGIDVRYYLYYKVPLVANDIKEFPKLNKFIKRFYKTQGNVETVQYKGDVFRRVLAYSARAYPEKVGTAILDSMKISAQVADTRSFDPFGGLSSNYKTRDIVSAKVDIEVMALPTEGMPTNFTGLVGNHEFTLSGGKEKYLVNEPIEFKLSVKGPGALENFQAQSLIKNDQVEDFDTKADLVELAEGMASKNFEFTYLARSELKIPEREISFSCFDPDSKKYVERKIRVSEIIVAGGAVQDKKVAKSDEKKEPGSAKIIDLNTNFNFDFIPKWLRPTQKSGSGNLGLIGPLEAPISMTNRLWVISGTMLLLVSFIMPIFGKFRFKETAVGIENFDDGFKRCRKNLNYENVYSLLSLVFSNKGQSVEVQIRASKLTEKHKNYFINLLLDLEKVQYSHSKGTSSNLKLDSSAFKSLRKTLAVENEEN